PSSIRHWARVRFPGRISPSGRARTQSERSPGRDWTPAATSSLGTRSATGTSAGRAISPRLPSHSTVRSSCCEWMVSPPLSAHTLTQRTWHAPPPGWAGGLPTLPSSLPLPVAARRGAERSGGGGHHLRAHLAQHLAGQLHAVQPELLQALW